MTYECSLCRTLQPAGSMVHSSAGVRYCRDRRVCAWRVQQVRQAHGRALRAAYDMALEGRGRP